MQQNFSLISRNKEVGSIHAELCWKERSEFIGVVEGVVEENRSSPPPFAILAKGKYLEFLEFMGVSSDKEP